MGKEVQIASGHHRVEAAKIAASKGIIEPVADIAIGNFDDAAMVRIYIGENATQRGNNGSAVTGGVASVFKYLLKLVLSYDLAMIVARWPIRHPGNSPDGHAYSRTALARLSMGDGSRS